MYITPTDATSPVSAKEQVRPYRMVSIILPSRRMNMMPLASPTTSAAERMSLHPARKSLAMLSASCLSAMPLQMPMAKKRAEISITYQS